MDVRFPDGTVVMACSLAERRENNPDRDFGLYLDPAWRPTWDAELIDWPDLGLPANPTVLACMAILAGVAAEDAVAWVRANYHAKAVETDDQSRWVLWFARMHNRYG